MSNNEFGCLLIVLIVAAGLIFVGVAGTMQQSGLRARIEQLESRTEFQQWWYDILDREYNKLRRSHEAPRL